ncbi:PHP domain-containing protein [Agaribacter flavus]|uniref:PHP domain-containing protein n=1 Tax=Agaribacter flavus TaxID=1902781 RepID=A0ABV7FIW8_9ALTE
MKVDLHSHTTCSDGQLSPKELIMRAQQMQVDMLAITDHDNIDAISQAQEAIKAFKAKIQLINGVEISTRWHGFEIHVLGLHFDENHTGLKQLLAEQGEKRITRARRITEKLAFLHIDDLYQKCLSKTAGIVSRVHIAEVLVEEGHCKDLQQAFNKFIGAKKRAYVQPDWVEMHEAVKVIQQAGGAAVLAHPFHYDMKAKWLRKLLVAFAEAGGDATEVTHRNISPSKRDFIASLAIEYKLKASIGSDFHAPSRWCELGKTTHLPEGLQGVWTDWVGK